MRDNLYIAWRYIRYFRIRTALLLFSLTLILFIPLALRAVVAVSEERLMSRAESTPLLLGSKGSSLDLAINALYFETKVLDAVDYGEAAEANDTGLALAIPLHMRFHTRGAPIVGTSLDYFDFRKLHVERGMPLTRLGDCVIGSDAARRLGVGPGDSLVSSPESLFDLAGVYPLKMHVAGVLAPSFSPDDEAVFVDLKTAWIIEGLGHGHQDLTEETNPAVVLQADEETVTAGANLMQFNEITEENIESFHFHGDTSEFPLTALVLVPPDKKSEDLLRGRYLENERYIVARPVEIVRGLLATIFRIEEALQSAFLLMGVGAALLITLVVMLSLRLRERELKTLYKLGCSRGKIAGIIGSELGLIALGCLTLTGALALLTSQYAEVILKSLVF